MKTYKWIGPRPEGVKTFVLKADANRASASDYQAVYKVEFRFETVYVLVQDGKGMVLENGFFPIELACLIHDGKTIQAIGPKNPYAPINMDYNPLARVWNKMQGERLCDNPLRYKEFGVSDLAAAW